MSWRVQRGDQPSRNRRAIDPARVQVVQCAALRSKRTRSELTTPTHPGDSREWSLPPCGIVEAVKGVAQEA